MISVGEAKGQGDEQRASCEADGVASQMAERCHTVEDVMNAVGKEQFLNTLPTDKKLWVLERKPETCVQAGELADEYEQARRLKRRRWLTLRLSQPDREVSTVESRVMPRKTAIREKEKKVNKAEVLSVTTVKSKGTCRENAQIEVWCARNGGTGDEQLADQCTRLARWRNKRSPTFFMTQDVREQ